MPDLPTLVSETTFGAYTITQGVTAALPTLASTTTIASGTWIGSPTTTLLAPLASGMSFGRYRWAQHTGPYRMENPLDHNGTTYQVLMTGGHVGLPDILIPSRTIQAEEGAYKVEQKILEWVPGVPGTPGQSATYRRVVGLAASSDYGADRAVIGASAGAAWVGSTIVTVAMTDDPTGNVYSTVLNTGSQRHIFRHLMTGTMSTHVEAVLVPSGTPPIHQIRAISGQGLAVVTSSGFYFFSLDLTLMEPRNAGVADATSAGRLSLLPDGSLIVRGADRLYKSTNLGLRWTDTHGNLPPFTAMTIRDVYVASSTHWYLATNQGVWKTVNGGETWSLTNNNLTPYLGPFVGNTPTGAFSIHGSATTPHVVIVGLRGHVARTTNGGATWAVFGKEEGLSSKVPNYRVHQAGTVLLAAYSTLYEHVPTASIWRSEDSGASWQGAFLGADAVYVNDFASIDDLVVIATPQNIGSPTIDAPGTPGSPGTPPVAIEIGTRVSTYRHANMTVTADVDAALLAAIAARIVTVDNKKAQLIVRQVKDFRTAKYYQTIASGEYQKTTQTQSSLAGLTSLTLTARGRDVTFTSGRLLPTVARIIPTWDVVGVEGEGAGVALSLLIDETFVPYTKISWQGTEHTIFGITYAISETSRLMALNTKWRMFAVPTSEARAGVSKQIPVFSSPKVTARRSR